MLHPALIQPQTRSGWKPLSLLNWHALNPEPDPNCAVVRLAGSSIKKRRFSLYSSDVPASRIRRVHVTRSAGPDRGNAHRSTPCRVRVRRPASDERRITTRVVPWVGGYNVPLGTVGYTRHGRTGSPPQVPAPPMCPRFQDLRCPECVDAGQRPAAWTFRVRVFQSPRQGCQR